MNFLTEKGDPYKMEKYEPKHIHRLTGNHDYGSFHNEDPNKGKPLTMDYISYSTTNTQYGCHFRRWGDPEKISLMQTPESVRRVGQVHNFRNRNTTSKEIGSCYEGLDPATTGAPREEDRFTLRQALIIKQQAGNYKEMFGKRNTNPAAMASQPQGNTENITSTYQPSVLEPETSPRRSIQPTMSMTPQITITPTTYQKQQQYPDQRTPSHNSFLMADSNAPTPKPSPGVISPSRTPAEWRPAEPSPHSQMPAMVNNSRNDSRNRYGHHHEIFVPSVRYDETQNVQTSFM